MKKGIIIVLLIVCVISLYSETIKTISSQAILGVSKSDYDILVSAAVKKDARTWIELLMQGRAFIVEGGTKVYLLDVRFLVYQVRIISGPMTGKIGWIAAEFVH